MTPQARFLAVLFVLGLLFHYAPTVLADNCSSADDCGNVVSTNGCLAAILALGIGTAAAATNSKPPKKKKVKNCAKAVDWVQKHDLGETDVRLKPNVGDIARSEENGTHISEADVTYTVDSQKTTITVTRISWSNMSAADTKAANDLYENTSVHEQGHVTVGRRVAEEHSGKVTGKGDSPAAADRDLRNSLKKLNQETQDDLDKQAGNNGEYDKATDHGRHQSQGPQKGFPGGKDVRLDCP